MRKYFIFMDLWFQITPEAYIGWIRTWKLFPFLTGFSLLTYLSRQKNIFEVYMFVLTYLRQLYRSTKKRENEGQPLMSEKDAIDGEPSSFDTVQKLKHSKKQKVRQES